MTPATPTTRWLPAPSTRCSSQNVDAIVGAASSSVTLSVIDKITTAGVMMFSPANTSKKLSTYADKGLYFRDAPSDILQGGVLADTVVEDGNSNVYILALNDDYGTGLAEDFTEGLRGVAAARSSGRRSTTRRLPTTHPRSSRQGGRPRRDRADRLRRVVAASSPRWSSRASARRRCRPTASTATWATPSPRTSRTASNPSADTDPSH